MILETLDLLADWLNDPTNGVNAKLAAVPRSGTDTVPPDLALIVAETRDFGAALGQLPDQDADYPCLLVSQSGDGSQFDPHAKQGVRDAEIDVLIRYGAKEAQAAKGSRDALYTFRAVQRSVEAWMESVEANRERNGIYVWFCTSMVVLSVWQQGEGKVVTCAMRLRFKVRDTAP